MYGLMSIVIVHVHIHSIYSTWDRSTSGSIHGFEKPSQQVSNLKLPVAPGPMPHGKTEYCIVHSDAQAKSEIKLHDFPTDFRVRARNNVICESLVAYQLAIYILNYFCYFYYFDLCIVPRDTQYETRNAYYIAIPPSYNRA